MDTYHNLNYKFMTKGVIKDKIFTLFISPIQYVTVATEIIQAL